MALRQFELRSRHGQSLYHQHTRRHVQFILDELQVGAPGNRTVTINGAGAAATIINQTNINYRVIDLDRWWPATWM